MYKKNSYFWALLFGESFLFSILSQQALAHKIYNNNDKVNESFSAVCEASSFTPENVLNDGASLVSTSLDIFIKQQKRLQNSFV